MTATPLALLALAVGLAGWCLVTQLTRSATPRSERNLACWSALALCLAALVFAVAGFPG